MSVEPLTSWAMSRDANHWVTESLQDGSEHDILKHCSLNKRPSSESSVRLHTADTFPSQNQETLQLDTSTRWLCSLPVSKPFWRWASSDCDFRRRQRTECSARQRNLVLELWRGWTVAQTWNIPYPASLPASFRLASVTARTISIGVYISFIINNN